MALQRIDELPSPPIVGQRYLVPTVKYQWRGKKACWPVMGPRHEDKEHLNFPLWHYHVDIRFLTPAQMKFAGRDSWRGSAEYVVAVAPLSYRGRDGYLPHPDPVYRTRECQRSEHSYPRDKAEKSVTFVRLFKAFAGRKCRRNAAGLLICPHKGFPLDSLEPDADGVVVCPLHGLRIDVRAGVVLAPERAS